MSFSIPEIDSMTTHEIMSYKSIFKETKEREQELANKLTGNTPTHTNIVKRR